MTCRDCIHERVCEKLCPRGLLPYQSDEYPAELFCKHFKDKADVVEVVRCKDCKRCELRYPAKAIGEEAIEGYYCRPNQRYVKSTDFCSYGTSKERSENNG